MSVVRARLATPGSQRDLPARITVDDHSYCLTVDVAPDLVPDSLEATIHLDFDTYFVPARRPDLFPGSTDNRHLVLIAPESVKLLKAP